MKRTKEEAAETRRRILKAAEQLFLDRGYENVTLDEIASAVGSSRGAVHWHFGNKQGLLLALRDDAVSPLKLLADELDENGTDDILSQLSDTLSSLFFELHSDERRRGIIRLMMHLDIMRDATEGGGHRVSHEAISRMLAAANRRNQLRPPWTPKTAASAINAVVSGILEEWALERSDIPLVPYAQELVSTVLSGFSKKSNP